MKTVTLALSKYHPAEKAAGGFYGKSWHYRQSGGDGSLADINQLGLAPRGSHVFGGYLRFNTFVRGDRTFTERVLISSRKLAKQELTISYES